MVENAVHVESDAENGVGRRVEALRSLIDAPPEVLETIREVMRIKEGEKGWRSVIYKLQSLEGVPVVGRIALGVADLLVGNLVARRTEGLTARGVKPYTGPPSGTPTK